MSRRSPPPTETIDDILGRLARAIAAIERARIVARLREFVEELDPTQPWMNKSEPARLLNAIATEIEEEGRSPGRAPRGDVA